MKTAKSDRQKAMKHIKTYLDVFKKGDIFYGIVLAKYVREKIGHKEMFPDTVLRYLRDMRSSGKLNYEVTNKRESTYIKL